MTDQSVAWILLNLFTKGANHPDCADARLHQIRIRFHFRSA